LEHLARGVVVEFRFADAEDPSPRPEHGRTAPPRCSSGTPEEQFSAVWQRHSAELFQRCRAWMSGNEADAKEAFSQAASLGFRKFAVRAPDIADLRAWLLRLTYNACMDVHRQRKRRGEESLAEHDEEALQAFLSGRAETEDPERRFLQSELAAYLERCIRELPSGLRDPLKLRIEQRSYREIADRLAINEAAVRKRVQLGREMLLGRLEDYRAGRGRKPSTPRRNAARDGRLESEAGGPGWRPWDLRAVQVITPAGRANGASIALHGPPGGPSKRRRQALEAYIRQHPTGWKKRLDLARLLVLEGSPEAAEPLYRFVVHKQPRRLDAWLELAAVLRLLERRDEACAVYEEAARILKDAAGSYLHGLLLGCRDDLPAAEEALLQACRENPRRPAPLVALAEIRWRAGRPHEALAAVEAALALDADDAAATALARKIHTAAAEHVFEAKPQPNVDESRERR
jgi:RNA polymerase sigma factor (sigma-70 family)